MAMYGGLLLPGRLQLEEPWLPLLTCNFPRDSRRVGGYGYMLLPGRLQLEEPWLPLLTCNFPRDSRRVGGYGYMLPPTRFELQKFLLQFGDQLNNTSDFFVKLRKS